LLTLTHAVSCLRQQRSSKTDGYFDLELDGHKKARLVAKGFSQVEGIDYDEIFSPVVQFKTVQMMLTLAALRNWHISGLDIKTAFLYRDLNEELYMEQPDVRLCVCDRNLECINTMYTYT